MNINCMWTVLKELVHKQHSSVKFAEKGRLIYKFIILVTTGASFFLGKQQDIFYNLTIFLYISYCDNLWDYLSWSLLEYRNM